MTAVRDEMDVLLDASVNAALALLEEHREFYPFAMALAPDDTVVPVAVWDGDDRPESAALIQSLQKALVAGARKGKYKATALVSDVELRDEASNRPVDAIRIQTEHCQGEPVTCYLPYHFNGSKLAPGELSAERGERRIFKQD